MNALISTLYVMTLYMLDWCVSNIDYLQCNWGAARKLACHFVLSMAARKSHRQQQSVTLLSREQTGGTGYVNGKGGK